MSKRIATIEFNTIAGNPIKIEKTAEMSSSVIKAEKLAKAISMMRAISDFSIGTE